MTQPMAILGAGLTGLSAAWSLATRGHKVLVFERDATVGGLAKSVAYQGFTFDIGPHRLLAPQGSRAWQLVHSLLGTELQVRHRQSRILRQGTYVDYPLQAHSLFANTTVSANLAAVGSFLRGRARWYLRRPPDTDFAQWVINRFGQVLYETHFRDYTTKLWGLPPTDISADWALERISQLTLWDMVRSLVWPARQTPRTHASAFYYPRGGVGAMAEHLAQAIRQTGGTIALSTVVTGLETQAERIVAVHWVETSSGQEGRSKDPRSKLRGFYTVFHSSLSITLVCCVPQVFLSRAQSYATADADQHRKCRRAAAAPATGHREPAAPTRAGAGFGGKWPGPLPPGAGRLGGRAPPEWGGGAPDLCRGWGGAEAPLSRAAASQAPASHAHCLGRPASTPPSPPWLCGRRPAAPLVGRAASGALVVCRGLGRSAGDTARPAQTPPPVARKKRPAALPPCHTTLSTGLQPQSAPRPPAPQSQGWPTRTAA
jgi:monoamine oxidase